MTMFALAQVWTMCPSSRNIVARVSTVSTSSSAIRMLRRRAGAALFSELFLVVCTSGRALLAFRFPVLATLLDRALDLPRVGGLYEVVVEARCHGALAAFALAVAGHRDEQDVARIATLAQLPRHRVAVEAGETDVEHDDVRREHRHRG